jgi:hypothetical protein
LFPYHNFSSLISYQYDKNSFYYKKVKTSLGGYLLLYFTYHSIIFNMELHEYHNKSITLIILFQIAGEPQLHLYRENSKKINTLSHIVSMMH